MSDERPGSDANTWLGSPSKLTRISYAIVRGFFLLVAKVFGSVTVIGADKLPATGSFIVAPVHRSNIDFALMSLLTRRPMRFMGKDSIWKVKIIGRFVSMLGAFPVHRGSADRESLRACTSIIEGGSPLVMFPEGARCHGPVVEELFDGTSFVATKTDVLIYPVGIGGSEAMMPKGAKRLYRSKVTLLVGDPIQLPERTASGRVSRTAVKEVTAILHERLQEVFDQAEGRA